MTPRRQPSSPNASTTARARAELETQEKKGYDTGLRVKHPVIAGAELPVFIANFILMDYGTGAIFGCPAHDQRDLEFARAYGLPVIPVVLPPGADAKTFAIGDEAYTGDGTLINSGFLDGLTVDGRKGGHGRPSRRLKSLKGSRKASADRVPLARLGHLATALLGLPDPDDPLRGLRHRAGAEYGPSSCPEDVTFDGAGNPLDRHPTWKHVTCPRCGGPATRETDTMDTFVDSSWYFARFCSPHAAVPTDTNAAGYWLPVDQYIGGVEHAILTSSMRASSPAPCIRQGTRRSMSRSRACSPKAWSRTRPTKTRTAIESLIQLRRGDPAEPQNLCRAGASGGVVEHPRGGELRGRGDDPADDHRLHELAGRLPSGPRMRSRPVARIAARTAATWPCGGDRVMAFTWPHFYPSFPSIA